MAENPNSLSTTTFIQFSFSEVRIQGDGKIGSPILTTSRLATRTATMDVMFMGVSIAHFNKLKVESSVLSDNTSRNIR